MQKQYKTFSSLAPKEEKSNIPPCTEIQDLNHRKDIIAQNQIVCIDLFADWCEPCKTVTPQFTKLAQQYNIPGRCMLVKENVDRELTRDYRINGIPAFIFYRNGQLVQNEDGSPVEVVGGDLPKVQETLNKLLGQGPPPQQKQQQHDHQQGSGGTWAGQGGPRHQR